MRLGGPIFGDATNPHAWIAAHKALGYSAAVAPIMDIDDPGWPVLLQAARQADLTIAEVGAWSNTIAVDDGERRKAIDLCCERLALADRIGAAVCVNIAGSRGKRWDGPHPDNLSPETFDLIVETVRQIIDAVKPTRAAYALESMPWVFPDSPENYLALIRAIDRRQFAVHLDPVNMINCPTRAYRTGTFIRECFEKLAPYIRSCHAKDIRFSQHLTLHLDECRPGLGVLDYPVFLSELAKLGDIPLLLEHLGSAAEYAAAADHLRLVAHAAKVSFR